MLWHFEFFVNSEPYGAGNFKTLFPLWFSSNFSQTSREHWLAWWSRVLAICQKLKMLWHFEIFVNSEPYGAGNFKTLFSLCFI